MIVFDLECASGHRFEGWFHNSASFEEQTRRKLVSCPVCEDTRVRRVLSPVLTKTNRPEVASAPESIDYRRLAKEIVDYVNRNFEDVGTNFAKEALRMHYGVSERKNIKGSATWDEEKMLKEEQIEFFKLPLPPFISLFIFRKPCIMRLCNSHCIKASKCLFISLVETTPNPCTPCGTN